MSCGFQGNSDIFGIGIRIGFYSQIFAVWFSNYFFFREAKVLRAVNNLFLLALIVAGFIYTFNAPTTYAIEAFLLLQIGIVVGVVGITEGTRYSTAFRQVSRERLVLRILIMLFGAVFNLLFWWKGLDALLPTPCDGIEGVTATYAFYFYKADIYGWMRRLMRVQSIFVAVFTAPPYVSNDLAALIYDMRMEKARSAFVGAVNSSISKHSSGISFPLQPVTSEFEVTHKRLHEGNILGDGKYFTFMLRVSEAQAYLTSIYSIYELAPAISEEKRSKSRDLSKFLTLGRRREKDQPQQICTDKTPYLRCLLRMQYGFFTNKPSLALWTTLCFHEITTGNIPVWESPRLVNRMMTLNDSRESPPDWHFFKIASDLALSQIPAHTIRRVWLINAVRQFLFVTFLVVQVELTITWNNVTGLQSVFQLGQLVPLIIGVGGLCKVLWGKARALQRGTEEDSEKIQNPSEYELAMARYIASKKRVDTLKIPERVATA